MYGRGSTFITLPGQNTLYKTGYTFSGWNTRADGTGVLYPPGEAFLIEGYSGLYAKWTVDQVPPTITTSSPLPSGTSGSAYSTTLAASSGTTPYTWSLASGSLPVGLSLSGGGAISGTPTASGTSSFTVRVTGGNGLSSTKAFSLTINAAPPAPTITTSSPLPSGTSGSAYSTTLAASGGTTPYSWALASGSLPVGLSLSGGGVISGTPTTSGTSSFTVRVTGGNSLSSTKEFSLTINPHTVSPNLTLYQPSGWSDKIVVSKTTGTFTDSTPIYPGDTIYVDWAVINNGAMATAARFYTELYVNGVLKGSWYIDPPLSGDWMFLSDYSLGALSAGTHTIKVKTDSTGAITESNEGDNEYTKTITVTELATVSYHPNGATGGSVPASQTKTHGVSLTLRTNSGNLARTGYTFTGWNTQANGSGTDYAVGGSYTADASATLYAKWTANPYTLNLDAQGGRVSASPVTVIYGSGYGMLPTPTMGGLYFAGWWTGPNGSGIRVRAETIVTTAANHTLYAKWVDAYIAPPEDGAALSSPGSYDGYFYDEGDFNGNPATAVRGTLNVKVTGLSGTLTAKAVLQKGSLSFSAKAWTGTEAEGTLRATLTARGGETLDLFVRHNRIWGTLSGGSVGGRLELDGARNRFADKGDAAAQALLNRYLGYYTVALPAHDALSLGTADAAPQGIGYLAVTVGKGGSAKIAGVLADGTKVTQSSRLVLFGGEDGACVPFFAPLYAKQGWAGGLLWVAPDRGAVATARELGWFVRWENPGKGPEGFRELLDACGGFYSGTPSLAAQYLFGADAWDARYVHADGAEYPVTVPDGVAVTAAGMRMAMEKGTKPRKVSEGGDVWYEYADVNPASATLTFAARTGLLKGKFSLYYDYFDATDRLVHKAVNVPYAGVLTPVRDAAFNALPVGLGHCLVPESDPALKAYKIKRSFPVWLEAE